MIAAHLLLASIGNAALSVGELREARRALEKAVAIRLEKTVSTHDLAGSQFSLAKALWRSRKRDRALTVAKEALANYQKTQGGEGNAATVEAWLAKPE